MSHLRFVNVALAAICLMVLAFPRQAMAETIDVSDNHGGSVAEYNARWAGLAARGVAHIPASRICVTPQASFGFHLAHRQDATQTLWAGYNAGIRGWINARGGLSADFKWMRAPDTYRFFKKCGA